MHRPTPIHIHSRSYPHPHCTTTPAGLILNARIPSAPTALPVKSISALITRPGLPSQKLSMGRAPRVRVRLRRGVHLCPRIYLDRDVYSPLRSLPRTRVRLALCDDLRGARACACVDKGDAIGDVDGSRCLSSQQNKIENKQTSSSNQHCRTIAEGT